ncbi:NAD(P)-dependent oxidoreductase [Nocardia goodfellowii]|uniref:3-hydroxyisobutyrate dehydrogenase-like beta-hydroxyacid dehydrogenase n=1 Tax=Nocardia goodfellowii TaxID=882446 RepID=A0ABS4QJT4_9NOCA|nr:NAD(P)-dependent oxidoreductase [Nocardia goodfellowii]MBP2191974.1 3-hydroxyisobutyrate dehydrogenase-like beta-hydroxyacid dehydrogenase [Nocardia goodfellowii]
MRVGFIGLGIQGGPMARRIAEAGHPTTLWARRPAALEPFRDSGAAFAGSPAELAAASDLVCLCVVSDADVREILTRPDGVLAGLRPGGVIAVHSTVHPDTCIELAETARAQGISLLDAPVSGGGPAAAAGALLVMVGGNEAVLRRCRRVFDSYARLVVHLGDVGAGQVTKIINNLLFTANLATAVSTLRLGESLGLEPNRLGELISQGTANSFALGRVAASGGLDSIAQHAAGLLRKDVGLAADLAARAGAEQGVVFEAAQDTLAVMDRLLGH